MAAKPKTRRSVSIKGLTYQRIKGHCESEGISVSGFLETLIGEALDREGVPRPTVLEPRPPRPEVPYQGQHFSF